MIEEASRRCGGKHTDAFKREYLAQIIRVMSKVIIPGFSPAKHVKEFDLPSPAHIQLTADWGGTRDMTVALVHTYDFIHNRLLIWDEKAFPPNTPSVHIKKDLDSWNHVWFAKHADVAGQTLIDLFELGTEFATPPKSDWLATVQSMSNLFEMDQIWIHPRCKFLIQSCRAGVFNKNRTDFERLPEIGHCDALAALMYANRVQERSNPYKRDDLVNNEKIFIWNNKKETEQVTMETMLPATKFPGPTRFGKFR
jgi:hypothetical protein